jgi:hypothetical protein
MDGGRAGFRTIERQRGKRETPFLRYPVSPVVYLSFRKFRERK